MHDVLTVLLSVSLKASWAVLAVLFFRFVLQSAPKWTHCLLWAVAALRLVLPFSLESVLSLVPRTETVRVLVLSGPLRVLAESGDTVLPTEKRVQILSVLCTVWLSGVLLLFLYGVFSYFRLYRRVSAARRPDDGIYVCDEIDKPFILGILKPKICLPCGMPDEQMAYVIRHERAHLKRGDHIWKPLSFLLLALHWFNPLLWLAYRLFGQDMELVCDGATIRALDAAQRREYTEALVVCGTEHRKRLLYPVAFGEEGIQERIVFVLSYRRQSFWRAVTAAAMCVVMAVCFLTDPVTATVVEEVTASETEETEAPETEEPDKMSAVQQLKEGGRSKQYVGKFFSTNLVLEDDVKVVGNGIAITELKCCAKASGDSMEMIFMISDQSKRTVYNIMCKESRYHHDHSSGVIYAVVRCKSCGSDLGAYYVGNGYYCEYADKYTAASD